MEKRITANETGQQDIQRGVDALINDLPNRFSAVDPVLANKVRLDVLANNHEESLRKLAEFEKVVAEWTIKSDGNANRIDQAINTIAEVTKNLGNVTGATFGESLLH